MFSSLGKLIVHLLIPALLPVSVSIAQPLSSEVAGVRVFELAYFAEFDPVTALDLVQRTPGFNPEEQSGGRGLAGVRSNILINGERPPPKGQSIWQQLSNLPYTSVTQIELIDTGATLDVDMQGYPQVVNVILEDERSGYYELNTNFSDSGDGDVRQQNERQIGIDATGSFSLDGHQFTVRGGKSDNTDRSPSGFVNIDPANPEQRVSSQSQSEGQGQFLELSSVFNLGDDRTLTVNAAANSEKRSSAPVSSPGSKDASGSVDEAFSGDRDQREVSAEYRRPLGERTDLMFAVVDSRNEDGSESSFSDEGTLLSSLRNRDSGESAARLRLTHKPSERLTLRSTLSSAFNYFEGTFQVLENGIVRPLAGSDSRVEEDRHSIGLEADWNWRDDWTLRSNISAGTYAIETRDVSSDTQSEIQGGIAVAYKPWERTTVTYESRYEIGQLSLNQFLASSNLSSEILQAGAASLDPERQRTHSLSYDQRFGDRGVLKFAFSRRNNLNPIRSVALSDELIVSQNTSKELINLFNASVEYPFERFGMEDLVLNLGLSIADSETVDPVSGETRKVQWANPLQWSFGMRKNPGDGRWAWGFNTWKRIDNDNYRVREIREQERSLQWQTFVEWEAIDGFKLRGRVEGPRNEWARSRFYSSIRQPGLDPSFIATETSRRDSSASFELEWRRTRNLEITLNINPHPRFRSTESLTAFGETEGTLQAREIARSPRYQIQFRLFRQ